MTPLSYAATERLLRSSLQVLIRIAGGKLHSPEVRLYDQDRESRPRELGPDTEAKPERVLNQPLPEECHDASQ